MLTLSVLIASYKRPVDLERCLKGLEAQTVLPNEVVVILRDSDQESWEKLSSLKQNLKLNLRVLSVSRPGVLAANNIALPTITSDLVSFIDDDACAMPDWIEKILYHFISTDSLGALGGRDRFAHPLMLEETNKVTNKVGRILWYGKIINYHHRVYNHMAEVDSIKGCNMTFKRELIERCDENISGNACYYELELCFQVKRNGFKVVFDGNLVVDHYLSENHLDRFRRGELHPDRVFNDYHNRAYVLAKHLRGISRAIKIFYWIAIEPHIAFLRFLRHRYPNPIGCWFSAMNGSFVGAKKGLATSQNNSLGEVRASLSSSG